jgi:hypothetical protein
MIPMAFLINENPFENAEFSTLLDRVYNRAY